MYSDPVLADELRHLGSFEEYRLVPGMRKAPANIRADGASAKYENS